MLRDDRELGRIEVEAQRSVFVDHPGHLAAAAALGMSTILHRSPEETIAELESVFGVPLVVSGSS